MPKKVAKTKKSSETDKCAHEGYLVDASFSPYKALCLGSIYGANACAGTAIKAKIGIDNVLAVIINGDSADGAFCLAGTATDAFVFGNNVSHDVPP